MADRLSIYRGALQLLGAGEIASLTEDIPPKRALDNAWEPVVNYVLKRGLWNFAIRTVELAVDDDVEPLFGYSHAFSKPTDWVRTAGIANEPTFMAEFEQYRDDNGYWFADADPLYVRYVSSDPAYGWNVGAWPQDFAEVIEARLAFKANLPVSSDRGNRNDMFQLFEKALKEAKTLDAVDEAVQRRKPGRLVQSRFVGGRNRFNGY